MNPHADAQTGQSFHAMSLSAPPEQELVQVFEMGAYGHPLAPTHDAAMEWIIGELEEEKAATPGPLHAAQKKAQDDAELEEILKALEASGDAAVAAAAKAALTKKKTTAPVAPAVVPKPPVAAKAALAGVPWWVWALGAGALVWMFTREGG